MTAKLILWGFTILGILPGLSLAVATLSLKPWPWPGRTPTLGGDPEFADHIFFVGGTKYGFPLIDPPLWAAISIVVGAVCVIVGLFFILHVPGGLYSVPVYEAPNQ